MKRFENNQLIDKSKRKWSGRAFDFILFEGQYMEPKAFVASTRKWNPLVIFFNFRIIIILTFRVEISCPPHETPLPLVLFQFLKHDSHYFVIFLLICSPKFIDSKG